MEVSSWFTDTAALAGIVAVAVSFVKTNVWKSLTGWYTVGGSVALGAALGLGGHFHPEVMQDGLVASLTFGVSAGFLASGGWDFVRGLLGKK